MSSSTSARDNLKDQIPISFRVNHGSMLPSFPMEKLRKELRQRIMERGDEFLGPYDVIVGTEDPNAPVGFQWLSYSKGQRGLGFAFGAYTEDGVFYPARRYALRPAGWEVDFEEFVRLSSHHSANVVAMRKLPEPLAGASQLGYLIQSPDLLQTFLNRVAALMSDSGQKKGQYSMHTGGARLARKKVCDLLVHLHPQIKSNQAAGKVVAGLIEQRFFRQPLGHPYALTFDITAANWLSDDYAGLAPRIVEPKEAPDSESEEVSIVVALRESVTELMKLTETQASRIAELEAAMSSGDAQSTRSESDNAIEELIALTELAEERALQAEKVLEEKLQIQADLETERDTLRAENQQLQQRVADRSLLDDRIAAIKARMMSR